MNRQTILPALAVIGVLVSGNASAITTNIYDFNVTRDGVNFFHDTFSDGLQPPASPAQAIGLTGCGTQCYLLGGTFPDGSEAGNRLRLDSALGSPGTNAVGTLTSTQRATLDLSTMPTPTQGLQASRTFQVSGLFDFVVPGAGETYTIALDDRADGHARNDDVQIQVANPVGTAPEIRFRRQDFVNGVITQFDSDPISASSGDQVRLILSHPTADTDTIFASYEFFKMGVSQGVVQLGGSASIFNGEVWTRPEFQISAPVPEPEIYAMMLVGLGLVSFAVRRQKQNAA